MKSPFHALLWEIWRVTRVEAAWKFVVGTGGAVVIMALSSSSREVVKDSSAAIAFILIAIPHLVGWLSPAKLNNGQPGFPLQLHYTRPVRTAVIVGLPMAYLTALSASMYLVSALLLRVTSGYAFPLLPVAAWIAALTLISAAAFWSTRSGLFLLLVLMFAVSRVLQTAMQRLTSVEIPGNYDWPPHLWPTLFDFPLTDYALIALIGIASFGVAVAGVARQRRGDGWAKISSSPRRELWGRLVDLFRIPCPTSSATRAQVWFNLKSNGLPMLTIGMALAIVILLVSSIANPIDAAFADQIRESLSCTNADCFFVRAWPPLLAPLALLVILFLGGNAFGIRRRQGRTYLSAFEATQAHGASQLALLKLLVKSACLLVALIALGASVTISLPLLGDAVFLQMWNLPLSSRASALDGAVAALTAYEWLALAVVAAVGVVVWVAALAVIGALWTRYFRRANIAASSLLVFGVVLTLLTLVERNGIVSPSMVDAVFLGTRWVATAAIVGATAYLYLSCLGERTLTPHYTFGAVLVSIAFVAAWVTLLRAAGVQLAGVPWTNVASMLLWPLFLPLLASVLAPWSYSRLRHQ
jgi:hypothetical protein